jgi:hypothetical protein
VDADGSARTVPPSAAACGITAQLENEVGVWAAPANRPVLGAFARADDAGLPEPGFLFEERIDEIRRTERGLMLLGARSTATDRDWTHLSVRRLIDWLKAQLAADLAWAPFEPNDALLWSAMANTARRRLQALFDAGALAGRTDPTASSSAATPAPTPRAISTPAGPSCRWASPRRAGRIHRLPPAPPRRRRTPHRGGLMPADTLLTNFNFAVQIELSGLGGDEGWPRAPAAPPSPRCRAWRSPSSR